jgi:hypothetical protein
MERVLKPQGLFYTEIPFMQQVHLGAYDFTRFTMSGHRYLMRNFSEIESGVCGGPGMALAWSISQFVDAFSRSALWQIFRRAMLPFFIFWLKYFDYIFIRRPHAADDASALYFLGQRTRESVSARAVVEAYWSSAKRRL